jgi:hypothetical protein
MNLVLCLNILISCLMMNNVLVGGTSLKTKYITNKCNCTCAIPKTSPNCSQCRRNYTVTYGDTVREKGCKSTCWDLLMAGQNAQVTDGVVFTRNTACSPWVTVSFKNAANFYALSEGLFVKNYNTGVFEEPTIPDLPPVISFPGLLNTMNLSNTEKYDNTTCKGRCCKLAVVNRNLVNKECDADISLCTSTDYSNAGSLPMCIKDASAPKCMVWIPCEPNSRSDFWILFAVVTVVWFILFVISFCVTGVACVSCANISVWIISVIALSVAFLAVVAGSDYSHWMSNTLVDKDYASYQSCVTYCNSNLNAGSVDGCKNIAMNMCKDGNNDHNPFAIWPANFNPYSDPYSTCSFGITYAASYCSSCVSVSNDWNKTRNAAHYVQVKSYIVIVICLMFCLSDAVYGFTRNTSNFRMFFLDIFANVVMLTVLFYFACFICSWYYVAPLIKNFGEMRLMQDILAFQGGGIPIIDICGGYIAVDFVCGFAFLFCGIHLLEEMKNNGYYHVEP